MATTLVLGASGYVGGRLVPQLVRDGTDVRCMTRSPDSVRSIEWAADVDVVEGDLLAPDTLAPVFSGVDCVVYLVHSLDSGDDFPEIELQCARAARQAAEQADVRHIVYLSGLGDEDEDLSAHLASRHAVGAELAAGPVPVTEFRAAVVIGAGSASFEMLRALVEVLPVMLAPRWVTTSRVQPVAISDVLTYLTAALDDADPAGHRIVEIGGPDVLTYRDLMHLYAEVAELRRRTIIPVPVVTPRLSTHWVNAVTPLPRNLSRSLIESLRHDVVVTDDSALTVSAHAPLDARTAIEASIVALEDLDIPTRWSGVTPEVRAAQPRPWDPQWSGGTVYADVRDATTTADAETVQGVVRGIGGERGWYGFGPLWTVRGAIDKALGGVGMRRGRRHPDEISVGEALDFWRVDEIGPDLFRLRAEMKLPGRAWLEWETSTGDDGASRVVQRARYAPSGLWGRLYWVLLIPFHSVIFPIMLRRIVGTAESSP
ncbi:MAG: SDR family oxidoreductase [Ilumatobacter sp.]|nr:SDR family oxidoreductase [Ilumatobacter sp.]